MNALLIVDVQNDFLPGGALAVPDGDAVVPVINRLQPRFEVVVATQDWHPANHGSFAANHPGRQVGETIELDGLPQILWPIHCVQHTLGACLVTALDTSHLTRIIPKGEDPNVDSYSGFFDNGQRRATGLEAYLCGERVSDVYVTGLATDYCVKATALHARRLGFRTFLIADACRGVNLRPDDVARALAELRAAGVGIVTSADLD